MLLLDADSEAGAEGSLTDVGSARCRRLHEVEARSGTGFARWIVGERRWTDETDLACLAKTRPVIENATSKSSSFDATSDQVNHQLGQRTQTVSESQQATATTCDGRGGVAVGPHSSADPVGEMDCEVGGVEGSESPCLRRGIADDHHCSEQRQTTAPPCARQTRPTDQQISSASVFGYALGSDHSPPSSEGPIHPVQALDPSRTLTGPSWSQRRLAERAVAGWAA